MDRLPGIILGVIAGFLLCATAAYMAQRWNDARVVSEVETVPSVIRGERGGWVLDLQYSSFRDTNCPNSTEHVLQRVEDNKLIAWPIVPSTVNVLQKLGPETAPHVRYELPPDIEPGRWDYVARAADFCEWLPGLVRTSLRATRPVPVYIPGG